MQKLVKLLIEHKLYAKSTQELKALKKPAIVIAEQGVKIYPYSLYRQEDILYFIGHVDGCKALYLVSEKPLETDFSGSAIALEGFHILAADLSFANAQVLKVLFPFTAPVSLRHQKTTIGCGDRLGLATAGHIRAARDYDLYPVLAQQSIRELNFTRRNYQSVTADTAFLVFQEGFERGYGADGDHLKTIADIDIALAAGMPMITLDLSEVMLAEAAGWEEEKIRAAFSALPAAEQERILSAYAGQNFNLEGETIFFSRQETLLCAVMYGKALDFARQVDEHLRARRGDQYDLEISIDETTTPTLPEHHLYIIKELNYRQVTVNSLAPRFIGDFQKGIDYIGDLKEFEKQFAIHCKIAASNGGYKISVHSGSDKFSVYPVVGKYTALRLHLKTAGTSWLEAVRCIALCNPALYRRMHKKAFEYFPEASRFYHITADLSKIPALESVTDEQLPAYLDQEESRQLLHITYGGLLNDPGLRPDFFDTLNRFEETHYQLLQKLFVKHIELLGVGKKG